MNDIGERLKETRENIGISIEEVSEDLKIAPSQIEEVEEGNMKAFKDIFTLKEFIKDYSKYLGLDSDEMLDDFNEYLFDYTSKLSLDEIKKADEEDKKKKDKTPKISSPYTIDKKRRLLIPPIVIWILLIGILGITGYFIYDAINDNNSNQSNVIE